MANTKRHFLNHRQNTRLDQSTSKLKKASRRAGLAAASLDEPGQIRLPDDDACGTAAVRMPDVRSSEGVAAYRCPIEPLELGERPAPDWIARRRLAIFFASGHQIIPPMIE